MIPPIWRTLAVTTCVVVWIEISLCLLLLSYMYVTTCVVVWIEIVYVCSSPMHIQVTTCVVVWIEIFVFGLIVGFIVVTTCVVVWIEIPNSKSSGTRFSPSPPAWWCGLKFSRFNRNRN